MECHWTDKLRIGSTLEGKKSKSRPLQLVTGVTLLVTVVTPPQDVEIVAAAARHGRDPARNEVVTMCCVFLGWTCLLLDWGFK